MNRKEIKEEARGKIKGNIWNIIWPLLVIGVIGTVISGILTGGKAFSYEYATSTGNLSFSGSFSSIITALVSGFLSAGYIKYLLNFIRTGKFDANDIINTIKEKWLNILIADVLVYIIVFACTLLFIIPGIIMGLAYSFAMYLVVDTDVSGNDSLKKSREMMKGYKWDYFVFGLSFLGWIILGVFTFGILYIWLIPYICVASCIYYDRLKERTK